MSEGLAPEVLSNNPRKCNSANILLTHSLLYQIYLDLSRERCQSVHQAEPHLRQYPTKIVRLDMQLVEIWFQVWGLVLAYGFLVAHPGLDLHDKISTTTEGSTTIVKERTETYRWEYRHLLFMSAERQMYVTFGNDI